jgi:hypothetical protein
MWIPGSKQGLLVQRIFHKPALRCIQLLLGLDKRMSLFFGQLRAQGQTVVPQQQRNTSSEVGSAARARFTDQLSALTDAKRAASQPRTASQFLRGGKDTK